MSQVKPAFSPTIHDTYETFTWKLFRLFLRRNGGWNNEQAEFEIALLKKVGFNTKAREVDLKNTYFRASRVGATKRLNRMARRGIVFTYQSACNHASIHFEK